MYHSSECQLNFNLNIFFSDNTVRLTIRAYYNRAVRPFCAVHETKCAVQDHHHHLFVKTSTMAAN